MSHIEERLHELGVTLPGSPAPIANYVPAKRVGNLVFTAGQSSGEYKGKLGATQRSSTIWTFSSPQAIGS